MAIIIAVVKAAKVDDANAVYAARGLGPSNFTLKACAKDPGATYETPPTHWYYSDFGTTEGEIAIVRAFENNQLPPVPDGVQWGVDGVIDGAAAQDAISAANFLTFSATGNISSAVVYAAACLDSQGLMKVPDEPL